MVAIVRAVCVLHPCGQAGGFVVQEDAAVIDGRFSIGISTWLDVECCVFLYGNIGPPKPWADSHLFRQLIDAVYRAALVAAGDDHGLAALGVVDGGDEIHFTFAVEAFPVDFLVFDELLDQRALVYRADDDFRLRRGFPVDGGLLPGHAEEVFREVLRCDEHSLVVFRAYGHFHWFAFRGQWHACAGRVEGDELVGGLCANGEQHEQADPHFSHSVLFHC